MKRLAFATALIVLLTASILAAQVVGSRTTSAPGITRRVSVDERTVQVVRSTYQPGAVEPPGPHSFDVVIVPLSPGRMEVTVAGKSIPWKSGEAFFIGRESSIALRIMEERLSISSRFEFRNDRWRARYVCLSVMPV